MLHSCCVLSFILMMWCCVIKSSLRRQLKKLWQFMRSEANTMSPGVIPLPKQSFQVGLASCFSRHWLLLEDGLPPTFLMLTEWFDLHVCFYKVSQHAALCWPRHALCYRRDWAAATMNCWMLHWVMWHQGHMSQGISDKGSFVALLQLY